jgi:isopenicillin N synthase-like dioxygenase
MGSIEHKITIPLIDFSPLLSLSPSKDSRDEIVSVVRFACQEYGFFQLTGHGIPLSLQHEVLLYAKRLFDLPLAEKQAMAMARSMGLSKRGYESGQILDTKPDTKEGFYIGFEIPPEDPRAGTFLKGPNFWPASLSDEECRIPVMEYHARVLGLHELLLGILADGLEYEGARELMTGFMEDPVANLKLLHYPPNPRKEGEDESFGGMKATIYSNQN